MSEMGKGGEKQMKVRPREEVESSEGAMVLIYGPTGSGKSTTAIQTSPLPILHINFEPRSIAPSIRAANRKDLQLDCIDYTSYPALVEFLANSKNVKPYRTVIFDSLTHFLIDLSQEIESENFDSKSEAEKSVKPLTGQSKLTLEGYGVLATLSFRVLGMLGRLSRNHGKVIICICLLSENPKYNRALGGGPSLKGRELASSMFGYFDLVGCVSSRQNGDNRIAFPPLVRFTSPDDSFVAKYTGPPNAKTQGILNIQKILEMRRKEKGE